MMQRQYSVNEGKSKTFWTVAFTGAKIAQYAALVEPVCSIQPRAVVQRPDEKNCKIFEKGPWDEDHKHLAHRGAACRSTLAEP